MINYETINNKNIQNDLNYVVNPYENFMVVFNRTKKNTNGTQLLGAKYHMDYKIADINLTKFSNNLQLLGLSDLVIFRVLSDDEILKLPEDSKKLNVYYNDLNPHFAIQTVSLSELINLPYFKENIVNVKDIRVSLNIIFIFEDIKYPDLLLKFWSQKIVLVGGKVDLQQIISPMKYRLSQIISCFEDGRKIGVNKSFHLEKKIETFGDVLNLDNTKPTVNWKKLNSKKDNK